MRPSLRRWIYLGAALLLLGGAARWIEPIQKRRQAERLTAAPLDQVASPDMVLPVLMAVGRAPVVDYLWLRAVRLKDEGRYFDALQLSKMICTLQPRFAPVWAFQAWNMAYNISVTQETGEERWRWVRNGIELLRDSGIPMNPHDTQLYRELAWIFFHKVADYMDEKHWYYKNQFALMMEDILGPGDHCDWEGIAAAPGDWNKVAADEAVRSLLEECKARGRDLSQPGVLLGLLNQRAERKRSEESPDADPVWEVLDDPARAKAIHAVECYWRALRVRTEPKLDPDRVVALRKAYGPLDFRLAEAHAFYWSWLGVNLGGNRAVRLDVQQLNADRIQNYCLQNMFRRGRLIMSPEARKGVPPLLLPDTRFIPIFEEIVKENSKRYLPSERTDQSNVEGVSANFEAGYVNFMRDAVVALYEEGNRSAAQEYFDRLRRDHGHPDYERGLDQFVTTVILDQLKQMTVAQALARVTGYITQGMALFAYGHDSQAAQYLVLARAVYEKYHESLPKRSGLGKFEELVRNAMTLMEPRLRPEVYARLKAKMDRTLGPAASQPAAPLTTPIG